MKILGQFKQKKIFVDLFMKCYLNFIFSYVVNFTFVNYNNFFEYMIE
jgi:hypothetical protein